MSRLVSAFSIFALSSTLFIAATPDAMAADLTVHVKNVQDGTGQLLIGLFDSADGFPRQPKTGQAAPAAQRDADGSVRVVFTGLPEGSYAVSAFHDRDGNGKLTTNLMGIPIEPYGFSGSQSGSMGPPAFKDVSFSFPAAGNAVTISLK